jgi:hypothetical protein
MGRKVELLENLGKEHNQVDYCGNDYDQPQFDKGLGLNLKYGRHLHFADILI